ncbi:glycine zipper domain-containing protein [Candidatus Omnitrophota bacterium]
MRIIALLLLVMMVFTGCETYLDETKSGALVGGGLGAGLGAIIGNQTGHSGAGTAIGAGAGALTGALVGEGIKRSKQSQQAQTVQYPQQAAQEIQAPAPQIAQVQTKYCPVCGKTYAESSRFCENDGTELKYLQ